MPSDRCETKLAAAAVRKPAAAAVRKQWGRFYTPPEIVASMLSGLCDGDARNRGIETDETPPTILDPACGDGAILLAAFERLRSCFDRIEQLDLVKTSLFGVDVDATAVDALRTELLRRVAPSPAEAEQAARAIAANIRVGDSLTGAGFGKGETTSRANRDELAPLDWGQAFPGVQAAGGFDVVISNPPYVREKHAKPMFDRIAQSAIGRKWREPRMDLWFYFLHRSLDLLKPGAKLSFIVNAYWTASSGARRMIERLSRETTMEEIVQLGDRPIFPGVSGRHMIFRLRKEKTDEPCRIVDSSDEESGFRLPQSKLFHRNTLRLEPPDGLLSRIVSSTTLGSVFEVRQGIAENPPVLSRRHCEILGDGFQIGQGVFVLSDAEVAELSLYSDEKTLLRPYFRPSKLDRYCVPAESPSRLLYLTRDTAPTLDEFPNIEQHLQRFRPILELRRETRSGKLPWWQLHWPREERLFTDPRILSVQMGREPRFAWTERPAFVGFSINVIVASAENSFSLPALTAILNSSIAARWFERHAKHRGVNLEINGGVLREFALPELDAELERQLTKLSVRQHAEETLSNATTELEHEIDECVAAMYRVSSS